MEALNFPEYARLKYCRHDGKVRLLPNGELACELCQHVCVRADGTVPDYGYGPVDPNEAAPPAPEEERESDE